jgi:predicted RNA-binding Zn-ribbon protein involved in translation (DUF1610 family)
MAQQLSRGTCTFCHAHYTKTGMKRHLETCQQRTSRSEHTEISGPGQAGKTFLLLVEEQRPPVFYWMYLALTTDTTLATLDQFLRDIWLECCGHLSAFEIAGTRYCVDEALYAWETRQKNMHIRLDEVLHPGQLCTYEYDFGSTTDLRLKVLSEQDAARATRAIQVLARNDPSFLPCKECGKAAIFTCRQCLSPHVSWLCESCTQKHPCDKEMLWPRVNSPRDGVCGYAGPSRHFLQQSLPNSHSSS